MTIGGQAYTSFQAGSRQASDAIHKFVEGDDRPRRQLGRQPDGSYQSVEQVGPDAEHKDFWDDFATAAEARSETQQQQKRAQPTSRKVEPEKKDFWDEFSSIGAQGAKTAQAGFAGLANNFNSFVNTMGGQQGSSTTTTTRSTGSLGTAAMRKPAASSGAGVSGAAASTKPTKGGGEENWDEW